MNTIVTAWNPDIVERLMSLMMSPFETKRTWKPSRQAADTSLESFDNPRLEVRHERACATRGRY